MERLIYKEYEAYKQKYLKIQKIYNSILNEQEQIFNKTQSKAIRYDKEKVKGGSYSNAFDEYLTEKEKKRIDERLAEVKSLLDDRGQLLKLKEKELRESKDTYDRVYTLKYLDSIRVYKIAKIINYSESQVYRILSEIDKQCEKMREN